MRILLASSSSGSRGGGELYQLYLGRALVNRGHEVSLWISKHPRMDELAELFAPIGPVIRSNYTNTYERFSRSVAHIFASGAVRRTAAEWRALQPDVIHLNKQNLEDGLDLLVAADRSGLPNLTTIHITQTAAYLRAKIAPLRDWTARRILSRYRGLLVPISAQREADLRHFVCGKARIQLVVNGVPIFDLSDREAKRSATRAQLHIPDSTMLVIAVARMVSQKRPMLWLDWAQKIHAVVPDVRFLWVGDGVLTSKFMAESATRDLGNAVRCLKWTNNILPYLHAADLFMHTAEFEGLPLAILEAMSAGLPVAVTTNLASEMPFLNPGNSITLDDSVAWVEMLRDRRELAECGRAARCLAEQKFSFDRMARDYEMIYRELAGRNTPQ